MSVSTPNCIGARCTLTNPEGTFYVTTPGTVNVNREYGDLVITCEQPGYDPLTIRAASSTKGMAFGNIIFGGIIGGGVDIATGAAYDYPNEIINPLDCRSVEEIAAAPTGGRYDDAAVALVNLDDCEVPGFVMRDGDQDVYRSRCTDGSVGVIGCSANGCKPLNVSRVTEESDSTPLPRHADRVQNMAREQSCNRSFHASDITEESETWMVKCPDGNFLVIQCDDTDCALAR